MIAHLPDRIKRLDPINLLTLLLLGPPQQTTDDPSGPLDRHVARIAKHTKRSPSDDGVRESHSHFLTHRPHQLGADDRRTVCHPRTPLRLVSGERQHIPVPRSIGGYKMRYGVAR